MRRTVYLSFVFFFGMGMLTGKYVPVKLSEYISFVIVLFLILYGYSKWRPSNNNLLYKKRYNAIVVIFFLLFAITPLVTLFDYRQDYISTLISQRNCYIWLFLPVLFRMQPTPNEIWIAARPIVFLSLLYWILSILFPSFFLNSDKLNELLYQRRMGTGTDIGFYVPGYRLVVFFCLFVFNLMMQIRNNNRLFTISCLLLLWVIMYQNRSSMIIVGVAFVFCFLFSTYSKTFRGRLILGCGLILFLPLVLSILDGLWVESQSQINQDNYNRWTALNYFLLNTDTTWYNFLFGHGVVGYDGGNYAKKILQIGSDGGYLADIGLIGTYWYYGIVPIVILLYFSCLSLKRKIPLYLKFYSLYFWIVPTIHTYLHPYLHGNLPVILYMYLILYYHTTGEKVTKQSLFKNYNGRLNYHC